MLLRWIAFLWLLIAAPLVGAGDGLPLPPLQTRVTDLTGTLSAEQKGALESASAAIQRDKGSQVAVLVLPTTQPETIEQFGIRLAEAWKIGRGRVDDGVIIIVAKDDRKMRLEVGYGLEGAIPDVVAKRIIEEMMAPAFRQGDFGGGLSKAVEAVGALIRGEALPEPAQENLGTPIENPERGYWILAVILGASVFRALLGIAGSFLAAGLAAALTMWIFGFWPLALIAAVAAFVFSFSAALGGGGGGGLGGGGFSSSSGGGGFSGGGGGFGGGGASGSW